MCVCVYTQFCLTLVTPWIVGLLCPWGFLGKNTGVGCHFLLQGLIYFVRTQSMLVYSYLNSDTDL